MMIIEQILTGFVALLHFGFMVLEMFLWQTDAGLKIFGLTPELAEQTAALAANQGLYNSFLAIGLVWSFFVADRSFQRQLRIFFLGCIIVAGIFGALTAKPSILFVQALPAFLAMIAVYKDK